MWYCKKNKMTYILFAIGFLFLIKGADMLVNGSSSIAKRFGVSDLIIGLTIVSFGTSAPELLVNMIASMVPKAIDESVSKVRRRCRHRFRQAIEARFGPPDRGVTRSGAPRGISGASSHPPDESRRPSSRGRGRRPTRLRPE